MSKGAVRMGRDETSSWWRHLRRLVLAGAAAATLLMAWGASSSVAAKTPWWHLSTRVFPSNLPPGGEATVVLLTVNIGSGSVFGTPVTKETFPAGISVQKVEFYPVVGPLNGKTNLPSLPNFESTCEHGVNTAQCHLPLPEFPSPNKLTPFEDVEMRVTVKDEGFVGSVATMEGEASGGETVGGEDIPAKTISQHIPVTAASPTYGVEHFTVLPEEDGGGVDAQAGSHPFQLTSTLTLNESSDQTKPLGLTRNLAIKLPAGLVGNASKMARCSDADFKASVEPGNGITGTVDRCSAASMVGVAVISIDEPVNVQFATLPVPIFNLIPERGEPARFGFEIAQSPVVLDTSVRTGADYGVTVSTTNITELAAFISSTVTFWGVPGDERHDESRGWSCLIGGKWYTEAPPCLPEHESEPSPLLSMPTACTMPFVTELEGVSWPTKTAPDGIPLGRTESRLTDDLGRELGITGCGRLRFEPSIDVEPDVSTASTPSGLRVNLHMPEEADETPNGLAGSAIKDLSVSLPQGVMLNPASTSGLEACTESAVGYLVGQSAPPEALRFSASLPPGWDQGSGFCPTASKIGTVSIVSRLLPPGQSLTGSVYLAEQDANPFGSLLAMYIVAEDPVSGVQLKLAGQVVPDPNTGQLTSTFHNMPQLPFEDATLHLFGGQKAPLVTPAACATYTTTSTMKPWSAGPAATPSANFQIGSGPHGSPCRPSRPFAPSVDVTPASIQAGAFSSLRTTVAREDGDQDLQSLTLHMPPGVSGVLSGVALCSETAAEEGRCAANSLIGEATVTAGVGSEPITVPGGKVYLTGPYAGAPFGLSITSPAKAGPFDLALEGSLPEKACDCIITRAKIEVDPYTAALTVTTDPATARHPIPRIVAGVPLQLRHIDVTVNRPNFTFNPTNCEPLAATGIASSYEGATAALSAPFQVVNCALLDFKPDFKVSVSGKTSKANGAGLSVRLAYPTGSLGREANIGRVKVELPIQLPSRLTTLQKACVATTFAANPAACPAASIVGHAKVSTPILPVPLEGPAYFVSHGNEAFPSLTIVLQGYGVTVDVVGTTLIKKGITSTTFKSPPDVPFSTFALSLPQGKYSALTSTINLCGATKLVTIKRRVTLHAHGRTIHRLRSFKRRVAQSLVMPTEMIGQNGARFRQNTQIAVSGCPKIKRHAHKGKKLHRRK